jgi:signal transduction histidine kinase/ActR/RegA family two-component response regulator
VSRALVLRTIGICAAILAVVLLTDYVFDTYLLPKPPPYNPWTTLWITVLVSPPIIFWLLWQGERVSKAMADLAQERAIRLAEAEQARDAAQAATRAKSVFLANMSHEIRTPLNGVLGMTQALEAKQLDPEARLMVETIRESGVMLMTIVNDVLDLSKIESGRMDIYPVDARLVDVVDSCCRLFKPQASEKGIELYATIDPSVPDRLSFDATRVRQCLCNLVSNAIKFTERGKVTIRVSARKEADNKTRISLAVADTGPGIDAKTQDRLFQAFAQADQSTTRRHGGTGLGLAISRDLARLMGGDIIVRSRPGAGAEFTLSFLAAPARRPAPKPRPHVSAAAPAKTPAAAREADDQRASRIRGARILLTDDNAINRQVARLFLQPQGAVITEAGNGRECIDLLEKEPFDLVLLDCNMPVMDGMEAIVRIRSSGQSWATLPVIALTANAMSGDRERLLALGMSGYVSKPVDRLELYAEIERALGAAAEAPAHTAPVAPGVPANDGPDLGDVLRTIERIAKR